MESETESEAYIAGLENKVDETVESLRVLKEMTEFQKQCLSQISLAVNLSSAANPGQHFIAELQISSDGSDEDSVRLSVKNGTACVLYPQFWDVVVTTSRSPGPNVEGPQEQTHRSWCLTKSWRPDQRLCFQFRLSSVRHAAQSLQCSLLFSVPRRYSTETLSTGLIPGKEDSRRSALLVIPVFSELVDVLHHLQPQCGVTPATGRAPVWYPSGPEPQVSPLLPASLQLGVSVPRQTSAASLLETALSRAPGCQPPAELLLWGQPVRLAAADQGGLSALTVSSQRPVLTARLWRALRHVCLVPAARSENTSAVRIPTSVLGRVQSLLELVRNWEGDVSRLLELWTITQQTVSLRLPYIT